MADSDYDMDEVLSTYRLDGSMLRAKSRVLLEDWIERIYPRIQDPQVPTSTLLDIGRTLIELGDMKPKNQPTETRSGPGFSITINVPQADGREAIVIEGVANADEDAEDTDKFQIPDFNLSEEDDG